jgi:hypothetical protein
MWVHLLVDVVGATTDQCYIFPGATLGSGQIATLSAATSGAWYVTAFAARSSSSTWRSLTPRLHPQSQL